MEHRKMKRREKMRIGEGMEGSLGKERDWGRRRYARVNFSHAKCTV